jgi:hypothetical protein
MNEIAANFLTHCFTPDETIALLLRWDGDASPKQRIVPLKDAIRPRYLAWLGRENEGGANIYVAANPLRSGSRQRTKENIACIRHLYIDIDLDGDARLAALRRSDVVPMPTAILSTSLGKYQVLWRVDGFDFACQERVLKLLAIVFGGDPACTDCNRVLRLPGFLNLKYDPPNHVSAQYPCNATWHPADFRLDLSTKHADVLGDSLPQRRRPGKRSNSELDWAWVCDQLADGKDAMKLTRELAARRSDKSNPIYYAQRTVDIASARLWLIHGTGINDVITMLECRRRLEIPNPLCSARAREIAMTAHRMTSPTAVPIDPHPTVVGDETRTKIG